MTEIAEVDCFAGPYGVAYWSGVRPSTVLDIAKETSSVVEVVFYSVDGFSTGISVSDERRNDVILAYEMNHLTLPIDLGYPIRLVVPNEFGYKWAKWVTHIEVVDYDYKGYWESRGWADDASITPISD
jgi:DMSO/TMAO reductase YedYZ molybdopterin-dependent catalytic subunit